MTKLSGLLKSYGFSILLIASVISGCIIGIVFKKDAALLKPLGDAFLIKNQISAAIRSSHQTKPDIQQQIS